MIKNANWLVPLAVLLQAVGGATPARPQTVETSIFGAETTGLQQQRDIWFERARVRLQDGRQVKFSDGLLRGDTLYRFRRVTRGLQQTEEVAGQYNVRDIARLEHAEARPGWLIGVETIGGAAIGFLVGMALAVPGLHGEDIGFGGWAVLIGPFVGAAIGGTAAAYVSPMDWEDFDLRAYRAARGTGGGWHRHSAGSKEFTLSLHW